MISVKKILLLVLLNTLLLIPVFAQDTVRKDMWVCPVFESGFYSISNVAFGGGAAFGYGDRIMIGLKVMYFYDMNEIKSLELNFLLRVYLFPAASNSGLFLQLNGGPAIFARDDDQITMPSEVGTFSAGLTLGWRFLLGSRYFIEPAIRAGYPYRVGAGLSAGIRF